MADDHFIISMRNIERYVCETKSYLKNLEDIVKDLAYDSGISNACCQLIDVDSQSVELNRWRRAKMWDDCKLLKS